MVKFLSKLGQVVLKGAQIAEPVIAQLQPYFGLIVPAITRLTPTPKDDAAAPLIISDLNEAAKIVTATELAGQAIGATGDQKLQMAAPQIAQLLLSSLQLAGHKVVNQTLFMQGATQITGGLADVLNSLDASTLQ